MFKQVSARGVGQIVAHVANELVDGGDALGGEALLDDEEHDVAENLDFVGFEVVLLGELGEQDFDLVAVGEEQDELDDVVAHQ